LVGLWPTEAILVTSAKAWVQKAVLDSRFRGNDEENVERLHSAGISREKFTKLVGAAARGERVFIRHREKGEVVMMSGLDFRFWILDLWRSIQNRKSKIQN